MVSGLPHTAQVISHEGSNKGKTPLVFGDILTGLCL